MWGRRKRSDQQNSADHESSESAREGIAYAERVIAHVDAQDPEINQIVARLESRARLNNFGESLMAAMEKRQ